ncbi:ribokinase [Fructobacillus sp. W13]|uniref:Ribokinase n=1 Tax=Fructobacillus apis TaxID=2935017 RepID=A0ABT0ZRJ0_9LACO|nr:ribokinase [Fructobacillus apis]
MNRILVIGSLNVDVLQQVERLPKVGETLSIHNKSTNFGGKGANQAVAAARQGADLTFVGAVGMDAEGTSYRELLDHEGIHTKNIQLKEQPTGTAYIMLEDNGHNTILVHGGANMALTAADVEEAAPYFKDVDVVIAQLEVPAAAIKRGFELAKLYGAITILNPAPITNRVDPAILANTDILVPNETEAAALLGMKPTTNQHELETRLPLYQAKLSVTNIIITLGEHGCFYAVNGLIGRLHNANVDAIDTTGAGDTFIGTVAAHLDPKLTNVASTLQRATLAAGLVVSRQGAIPAIPTKSEIDALAKHYTEFI